MNNINKNRLLSITIHISIWLVMFATPYIVGVFTGHFPPMNFGIIFFPIQIISLFYLNYSFLINKLLFNKKVVFFVVANIIAINLWAQTSIFFFYMLRDIEKREHGRADFPVNVSAYLVIIGLSVAIKMTRKWYEARQQMQLLEKANTEAELQHLKSQLNPHFLFNSLNNIYALIAFNQEKAQLSLHNLCDLLRYQLYESNRETIPLQKEIEFVRSYCDLMRLRLPKHVTLYIDMLDDKYHTMIAPLLLISIVENAFKHGVSQSEPSTISIKIVVEGSYVICSVINSYFPKKDGDCSGSGIGLENLRRRLELIYPDSHSFRAEKMERNFVSQLTIKT